MNRPLTPSPCKLTRALFAIIAFSAPIAFAADATWSATTNGAWSGNANWTPAAAPGATTGSTNPDTATFNSVTGLPIITVDSNRNLANITFSTIGSQPNDFLFSGGGFVLTAGGAIQTTSSYIANTIFNTGLTLRGNYSLLSNGQTGSTLGFNTITTATGLGSLTLTLGGSNAGYNTYNNAVFGNITQTTGTTLALSKTGTGTWFLSGTGNYTGGTTLNGGTLIVGGANSLGTTGTITVAGNSTIRTNVALTDPSARITINDGATLTYDTNNLAATWTGVLGNSGGSNTAGFTKTGLGVLTINSTASALVQGWRGNTTVNMGVLFLDAAAATSGVNNIINSNSQLVLGGGVLNFRGRASASSNQTFAGTVVNAGVSELRPSSSSGTNVINLGAITINPGGLLNITSAGGFTYQTSTANNTGGVIKGIITNTGQDFAANSSGNLVIATYTTQNNAALWNVASTTYTTNGALTGATVGSGGTTDINGLKLNAAGNQSFAINGTLRTAAGILFGSSIGANPSEISGGNLTSTSGDLIIVNNNAQNVLGRNTISSTIVDNGAPTNVIFQTANNGSVFVTGTNTYTGNTTIGGGVNNNSGNLVVGGASGARIGSVGSTVLVNGGLGGANNILRVGNGDATGDVLGTIRLENGALSLNRNDTNTLSAQIAGQGGGGYIFLDNVGNTTLQFASGNNLFYNLQTRAAGTLTLTGTGSVNTFQAMTGPSNSWNNNLGGTLNFVSGTYYLPAFANGGNVMGQVLVNGADVTFPVGRYFAAGGGNLTLNSGAVRISERLTVGEQMGGGVVVNNNENGGLFDVALGSGNTFGGSGASSQTSATKTTFNQSGGVAQFGLSTGVTTVQGSSGLTIGNGLSQLEAAYNLSGGTLRVNGTLQGAAATASSPNLTFTAGSNTATLPTNAGFAYVGQVLTGANATAAGVSGATVTGVSGTTVTLSTSASATVTGVVTATQSAANLYRVFNWSGGTLTAQTIDMTNLGGGGIGRTYTVGSTGTLFQTGATSVMAPGEIYLGTQYTGRTAITGNYVIDDGTVAIGIGGTSAAGGFHNGAGSYDNITVTGNVTLGGRLAVSTHNSYTPPSNTTTLFNIMTIGTVGNTFSGNFTNLMVASGGNQRIVLSDGLSSMLVGINNTGSATDAGGLTAVGARTVAVGGYQATNTYNATSGSDWNAGNATSWTNFDAGSSTGASGAIAQFADGAGTSAGDNVVNLTANRNIRGIQFSSANATKTYTLNGTGTLVFDNRANAAAATIADTTTANNTINLGVTLNSNLNVTVQESAATLTLGGNISGSGTGLTKVGDGRLVLSGTNTFNGTTTIAAGNLTAAATGALSSTSNVTISSATLEIAAANAVNDSASVTLANGTIAKGAGVINETFGALNLVSNSNVDFGSGTGSFTFATFNPGAFKLKFLNFNLGNSLTVTTGTYNASEFDFNGFETSWAPVSGGFTITAIPEPSAVAAALAFLGLAGLQTLRRRKMNLQVKVPPR